MRLQSVTYSSSHKCNKSICACVRSCTFLLCTFATCGSPLLHAWISAPQLVTANDDWSAFLQEKSTVAWVCHPISHLIHVQMYSIRELLIVQCNNHIKKKELLCTLDTLASKGSFFYVYPTGYCNAPQTNNKQGEDSSNGSPSTGLSVNSDFPLS